MEYQYYEFQSLDRPLTSAEIKEISAWSSRAIVTNRRAIFTYAYGDFKKDIYKVTARYFDAALYQANWGTRQLLLRFPKKLVDLKAMQQYCLESYVEITEYQEFILVEFRNGEEPEGGDWIDENNFLLTEMLSLRDAILQGDYRSLFMGWLSGAALLEEYGDDNVETMPPIPAGLQVIGPALNTFTDFLEMDVDLIAGAAFYSADLKKTNDSDLKATISKLPEAEQLEFLKRLAQNEPGLSYSFQKRLQEFSAPPNKQILPIDITMADIMTMRDKATNERIAQEARKSRIAYEKKMETIRQQEAELWKLAIQEVNLQTGRGYENATATLKDLQTMALHFDKKAPFEISFSFFLEKALRSKALWERFERAGLVKGKRPS